MTRTVEEWRGRTDDERAPPRVRARVFAAHGGVCHRTGRKIMPGEAWELDHVVALINGGRNVESNLAPILAGKPHREKTSEDMAIKAKTARMRAKHLGITRSKQWSTFWKSCKYKKKLDGTVVPRNAQDSKA